MRRLLIAIAAAVPAMAPAQEAPPEGCFCLAEAGAALPQIQRGCERQKFPAQFYWRAFCRYVDPATEDIVVAPAITITEAWTILPKDHPDCAPCEPELRDTKDPPRDETEDGSAAAPDAGDTAAPPGGDGTQEEAAE